MMRTFDLRYLSRVVAHRQLLSILLRRIHDQRRFGRLVRNFASASSDSKSKTLENVDQLLVDIRKYEPLIVKKVKLISNIFDVSDKESEDLLDSIGQLKHHSVSMIYDKIKLLQSYDIPLSAIKNKFHVLQLDLSALELRLEEMGMFDIDWTTDTEKHLDELMEDEEFIRGQWKKKRALLAYCLQCSEEHIEKISTGNPEIYSISLKKLKKNLDILLAEKFVDRDIIFRSISVLTSNSDKLVENLNFVKQLIREEIKGEFDNSEPSVDDLLKLESSAKNLFTSMIMLTKKKQAELSERLRNSREILGGRTREEYLAERLDCDVSVIKKMVKKYPRIQMVRIMKLKTNLDLLLNSRYITPQDIINCPNVLTSMPRSIEKRIEQLDKIGFSYEHQFLTAFRNLSDEHFHHVTLQFRMDKEILEEAKVKDKQEYFCKRLGCSEQQVETLFSINPMLKNIKLTKIKAVMDFLQLDCGASSREILSLPRVFSVNLEMMMSRKKELDELGKVVTVRLLCSSLKQFQQETNMTGAVNI